MTRRWTLALLLLVFGWQAPPSAKADGPPVLPAVQRLAERTPVVLLPGITGTKLRDRKTGEVMWGESRHLLRPRDGGYALARPIHEDLDDPSELEGFAPIESISLAGFERDIYGPILELLRLNGYRLGDLARPEPTDDAFVFPYDWHQDNVVSAGRLAEALEGLRRVRGDSTLSVVLICQSNGAHICRYLAKYGGAPLEDAEAGTAALPSTLAVHKLILLGSSNGGALRNLREIDRGRTYVPVVGRKMRPETLFTFPSLYQDMPVLEESLFVDRSGRIVAADLGNADDWRRLGFSAFDDDARRRMSEHPEIFGNELQRLAFLRRSLERARRIHRVLLRDAPQFDGPSRQTPRYYSIQSHSKDTSVRAVLVEKKRGWDLLFSDDGELDDLPPTIARRLVEAGDSHASIASQNTLSPQEKATVVRPTAWVDDGHRELLANPATLEALIDFLADDESLPTPPAPVTGQR